MKPIERLFETIYPQDGMLVIGIVAQVGTNLDDLSSALKNRLKQKKYLVHEVSLSEFLTTGTDSTTKTRQEQGNVLRRSLKCNHALALAAVAKIRNLIGDGDKRTKQAFIVRSLKRPEEVEALRIVYGEAFLALGVHTPRSKRIHFLRDVKSDPKPQETVECDENADDFYGQRTRDTYEFCDFFIKGIDPEHEGLERALKVFFGSVFETPTIDEYAMSIAYDASLRSSDLSRQVGAAIINRTREIVAVGANEVPLLGGGQPWSGDKPDYRDFAELKEDPNVTERNRMIDRFIDSIKISLQATIEDKQFNMLSQDDVERALRNSGLSDITEFGRSVHAEMAALMSALRNHVDISQGTLFTTTFPCHNCMRHILASGLTQVKYVEPYPKSRAKTLFNKSCSFWDEDFNETTGERNDPVRGLRVEPFIGIGPRKFNELFSLKTLSGRRISRKDDTSGKAKEETTASLVNLKTPASHIGMRERENLALSQLKTLWQTNLINGFEHIGDLIVSVETSTEIWRDYADIEPTFMNTSAKMEDKQKENLLAGSAKSGTVNRPKVRKKASPKSTGDRPIIEVEEGQAVQEKKTS